MEIQNLKRIERFWDKVDKNGPFPEIVLDYAEENYVLSRCWIWIGAKDSDGYGNFTVGKGKTGKAHRFSFKLAFGWILSRPYQIDHKCNNPSCVNPKHLICLLGKENNEKSTSPSALNKRKVQCKRGHSLSGDNIIKKNGRRICVSCEKERGR